MTKHKRSKAQRESDLQVIARMYLRGIPQHEMVSELAGIRPYTITRQQVSYDLKTIHARWLESSLVDFGTAKAKELAAIDDLERTYWQAWEESRQQRRTTTTKKLLGQPESEYGDRQKVVLERSVKRERSVGNPAFLSGVQWCISKRCEIFGFDAPKKIEITDWRQEAQEKGIDVTAEFERLVSALEGRESAQQRSHPADDIGGGA